MLVRLLGLAAAVWMAVQPLASQDFDRPPPRPTQGLQRIACVGDSITAGATCLQPGRFAWPAQLRERLNATSSWERVPVQAFGVGGATLLRDADRPHAETPAWRRALEADFDHMLVMLGTNDTVEAGRGNWSRAADWERDLQALVDEARAVQSHATIWLAGPPPMFPEKDGLSEERRANLRARAPRLAELQARNQAFAAAHEGVEWIDLSQALQARHTTDGVHPNSFGHESLARALHSAMGEQLNAPNDPRASTAIAPSAEYRSGAGWGGTWWEAFDHLHSLPQQWPWKRPQVVFLGDSITQGLTGHRDRFAVEGGTRAFDRLPPSWQAVSLGLSGDRTEHLRYRIRKGALPAWDPRVIVLQIGINNLNAARHSAADTLAGITAVVDDLKRLQPWATILICGPFPAGRTPESWLRQAVDEVHAGLPALAVGSESAVHGGRPQVQVLDLRSLFLNEDGSPGPGMAGDALHINSTGQQAWLQAVKAAVQAELDRPLIPQQPAALAFMVDQDDYPLVSRRLMVLEPGAPAPTRGASPILWSFDAHDGMDLQAVADGRWVFTGPVQTHRATPNVGLPLQLADSDGVHALNLRVQARHFATHPAQAWVATTTYGALDLVDLVTEQVHPLLRTPQLGRTMPVAIRWHDDDTIELDLGRVAGGADGAMHAGRWHIHLPEDLQELAEQTPTVEARGSISREPGIALDADRFLTIDEARRLLLQPEGRELFAAEGELRDLTRAGDWVAFTAHGRGLHPQVYVLSLETLEAQLVGPGQLPRWARIRE